MLKKITITGFLFLCVLSGLFAAEGAATRRLGIFIGSNNGGRDRVMLRYAISDAKSVSQVFTGMGGIAEEDSVLLVEPTVKEINRQIDNLGRISSQSRRNAQRTELVFYYSGHSDETGLLLNRERYGYQELRDRINTVQADMRIVILDSCSSGAITRAKGGVKTQPFLFDTSVSTTGYAFLTSSSADEVSQESDAIESSYFTHSLLAGLRGAADSVGDGRVTLNELYRFAYTETLARTETSVYGAQHPSYDIQISGSGDVVLTDIKETSSQISFSENLTGRISIRDSSDFLVAELSKINNKPLELGLEPGLYRITLQQGNNFYRAEITLPENQRVGLNMGNFQMIASDTGNHSRSRGDNLESASGSDNGANSDIPYHPVSVQFIPMGFRWEKADNNLLIGILVARGHSLNGIGAASLALVNTGDIKGIQGSGIFNYAGGSVRGIQGASAGNVALGDIKGIQGSGIFNYAGGSVYGLQGAAVGNVTLGDLRGVQGSSIFNYAGGSVYGLQASALGNVTLGNIRGVQGSGIFNYAGGNVQYIQGAALGNITLGDIQGVQGAGIFNYDGGNIQGIQAAGVINITGGNIQGVQSAGIINITKNSIYGIQSSLGNYAEEIYGLQAGLVNVNRSGKGAMIGLVNVSKSEDMVPIGLINIMENGMLHPAVYIDDMLFTNLSLRSGSKHFYGVMSIGTGGKFLYNRTGNTYLASRVGLGFEYCIKKVFIDIDATAGNIFNTMTAEEYLEDTASNRNTIIYQLRLSAGYKIFEHLGVFGGISYDILHRGDWWHSAAPDPSDFGGLNMGRLAQHSAHKLGIFGGIQF